MWQRLTVDIISDSFCSIKAKCTTFREIAIFSSDCHYTHLLI